MSLLTDDFWAAVTTAAGRPAMAGPYLIGSRLAWAAAQVLGAQGAGIGISTDATLRVPWGASSDDAATTEALQFTTGEGPCLTAYAEQDTVMATSAVLASSWPMFNDQFCHRTPYRSVCAVPMHRVGVLDLYFTDPTGCSLVDVGAAATVAQQILGAMVDDQVLSLVDSHRGPHTSAMTRRSEVAMAIGTLTVTLHLNYADALALMRAHAFAHDLMIDEVAAHLMSGALDPHHLIT